MVVLLLITALLRLYINTIEGRRDINSSFALVASNLEYDCFTSRRDTDAQKKLCTRPRTQAVPRFRGTQGGGLPTLTRPLA